MGHQICLFEKNAFAFKVEKNEISKLAFVLNDEPCFCLYIKAGVVVMDVLPHSP